MTNRERIERWLDKQIKIRKAFNKARKLKIDKSLTLGTCGICDYIHLYRCLEKIADILELPVNSEILEISNGEKVLQLSFMYNGYQFIQIGNDDD